MLLLRLARSATVSCLAVCASVLAHLLVAGHAPATRTVLAVAALVTLADLVVAPWSRRAWSLALRVAVLQVVVHVALTLQAVGGGRAVPAADHHQAVPSGPLVVASPSWAELLPSAPMLLVHGVVAVLVAVALTGSGRARAVQRAVRGSRELVRRLAATWRPVLLPVPAAVALAGPETSSPRSRPPVVPPVRSVWQAAVRVRRGPPALLAA